MRRFLAALALMALVAIPAQAASTFSGFPAASQPLGNVPDYVPLDQGTGCLTGGSCTTSQTPSLRVGQPIQTAGSASCAAYVAPPAGPFLYQQCVDNSTTPPLLKEYFGGTWWPLLTLNPSTGPAILPPASSLTSPFTLGSTSVTTTGAQLNYLNAATGTTGTTNTNIVFSGAPTIVGGTFSSPALTGIPTAPTAAAGTNTTQIATTAFIASAYYPSVPTNAALTALASTTYTGVWRLDYSSNLGAPPVFFKTSNAPCSLNAGAGDGASQVPTSDGNCWLGQLGGVADFREWGPVPGQVVNNPTQYAINWAFASHAEVDIFPPATPYLLTASINVGNGTSSSQSTLNAAKIIGLPSGIGTDEGDPANAPMMFKWTGTTGVIPFIVQGPLWRVTLSGISVDCNSLCATGFQFNHPIWSHFDDLLIRNWTSGGAFILTAYGHTVSGLAQGAAYNTFHHDQAVDPVAGQAGGGLVVGQASVTTGDLDPTFNTFDDDSFAYDATESAACGIILQYTDVDTFINGGAQPIGGTSGNALCIVNPTGATAFPQNISFENTELNGTTSFSGGWAPNYSINFYPFVLGDNAVLPGTAGLMPTYGAFNGITNAGRPFGQLTGSLISGNAGPSTVTLASTVQYVGQGCAVTASFYTCAIPMPYAGQIRSITGGLSVAPGSGQTVTFQLYKNNAGIAGFQCVISGASATSCGPVNVNVAVTVGDFIVMTAQGSSGATAAAVIWSVLYDHN